MDKSKVQVTMFWLKLVNLKQLKRFLGMTSYYREFIKEYATLASSLSDLLKKKNFNWNAKTKKAFDEVKAVVTQAPVLTLPDFS